MRVRECDNMNPQGSLHRIYHTIPVTVWDRKRSLRTPIHIILQFDELQLKSSSLLPLPVYQEKTGQKKKVDQVPTIDGSKKHK